LLTILIVYGLYIDKKENQIFLIYKEVQSGPVAKSNMRKGFLIYEDMRKYLNISPNVRRPLMIYDYTVYNCSILNFLKHEENLIFLFYQCTWNLRRMCMLRRRSLEGHTLHLG
jgi:hypothetical protein